MTRTFLASAAALLAAANPCFAGNGMNAYSTSAGGMSLAGADLAMANDIYALASNPAGLARLRGHEASGFIEGWWQPLGHSDELGNDTEVDNRYAGIAGGGYGQPLDADGRFVAGVAFFAQGGTGFSYGSLNNNFGAPDEMSAIFGVFRLAPGLAWRINDHWAVGATTALNYSSAKQKFLPDTSVPASNGFPGFQGITLRKADGISFSGKLGLLYAPTPQWHLALCYSSATAIKLRGGELELNYEADGHGRVRYRHARVSGLSLPQEFGVGAAYAPNDRWEIAIEANWVDWSGALGTSTLSADSPDNADVAQRVSFDTPLDWRDQYVFAIGARYHWNSLTQIRFGYNYGRNPVPDQTLSPVFNLISEHALGAGLIRALPRGWELGFSVVAVPPTHNKYSNPQLGLGVRQDERFAVLDLNLTVTRRW